MFRPIHVWCLYGPICKIYVLLCKYVYCITVKLIDCDFRTNV